MSGTHRSVARGVVAPAKRRRRHAHDGERRAVQVNARGRARRVGAEPAAPPAIADDGDGCARAVDVVGARERAAERRSHARRSSK